MFSATIDIILCAVLAKLLFWALLLQGYISGGQIRRGGVRILTVEEVMQDGTYTMLIIFTASIFFCGFWQKFQATPGMMCLSTKIVNARTGGNISMLQCIVRYIAYIPSWIACGWGIFSISMNDKKQGWHDKLAGTLIVKDK